MTIADNARLALHVALHHFNSEQRRKEKRKLFYFLVCLQQAPPVLRAGVAMLAAGLEPAFNTVGAARHPADFFAAVFEAGPFAFSCLR